MKTMKLVLLSALIGLAMNSQAQVSVNKKQLSHNNTANLVKKYLLKENYIGEMP